MPRHEPFYWREPTAAELDEAWRRIRPLDCTAPLASMPPVQHAIARMAAIALQRERAKGPPPPPRDAQLVRHMLARRLSQPRRPPAHERQAELFDPLEVI